MPRYQTATPEALEVWVPQFKAKQAKATSSAGRTSAWITDQVKQRRNINKQLDNSIMRFKAPSYLRSIQRLRTSRASTLKLARKREALGLQATPRKLNTSMKSTKMSKVKENGPFSTSMRWRFARPDQRLMLRAVRIPSSTRWCLMKRIITLLTSAFYHRVLGSSFMMQNAETLRLLRNLTSNKRGL